MKKLFQTILAGVCLLCAQSSLWAQTATLYHEYDQANPITFTGADAFVEAVNSSSEGDEIVLSSGTFNGCDVWTNSLKIYGVGAETESPTIINGVTIYGGWIRWEGIRLADDISVESRDNKFLKCHFGNVTFRDSGYWGSCWTSYYDCRFDNLTIDYIDQNQFYNCIIVNNQFNYGTVSAYFHNCILVDGDLHGANPAFEECVIYNCLRHDVEGHPYHLSEHKLKGCIVLTDEPDFDALMYNRNENSTQLPLSEVSNIFTDFNGSNATSASFQLTADALNRYTDSLGRTVGVYAGKYPYSMAVEAPTRLDSSVEILSVENGFADVHVKIDVVKK